MGTTLPHKLSTPPLYERSWAKPNRFWNQCDLSKPVVHFSQFVYVYHFHAHMHGWYQFWSIVNKYYKPAVPDIIHGCAMKFREWTRLENDPFAISNIKYDPRPENGSCLLLLCCHPVLSSKNQRFEIGSACFLFKKRKHSYFTSPLQDDHDKIMHGMLFPINHILL